MYKEEIKVYNENQNNDLYRESERSVKNTLKASIVNVARKISGKSNKNLTSNKKMASVNNFDEALNKLK